MIKTENFGKLQITSSEELRSWLKENHEQPDSIWLITFKKNEPSKYVSRWEVLDQLICYGWIDGIRRKLDDQRTMQLISKRKVEHWSKTYKDRAAKLIEEGRMQKAGQETIDKSKADGLWNYMDDVDNLVIPEDLTNELSKLDGAYEFFNDINPSSKRFVLRWIKLAKTEKTRNKRITQIAQLSFNKEKLKGS